MSDAAPLNVRLLQDEIRSRIKSAFFPDDFVQVRCVIKGGIFMVLAQHPAPAVKRMKPLFRTIRDCIEADIMQRKCKGLIYLRVAGQNTPYAFHRLPVAEQEITSPEANDLSALFEDDDDLIDFLDPDEIFPEDSNTEGFEGFLSTEGEWGDPTELPSMASSGSKESSAWLWVAGLLLLSAGGAGYAINRQVCFVAPCSPLSRATTLAAESQEVFAVSESPSGEDIRQAQERLNEAIATLESVPQWSTQSRAIAAQLAQYKSQEENLSDLLAGLGTAYNAAQAAKVADLTEAQWQNISQKWQAAISLLESIPKEDSAAYEFAQTKVASYRDNLATVRNKITQLQTQAAAALEAESEAQNLSDISVPETP